MIFHACRRHQSLAGLAALTFAVSIHTVPLLQPVYMMDLTHSDAMEWGMAWHLAMGCFCFNIIRFINQPLYLQTFSLLPHALSLLLDSNSTDMRTSDIIPPFYFLLCSISFVLCFRQENFYSFVFKSIGLSITSIFFYFIDFYSNLY